MIVGIPKETRSGETRVAATPDSVRKLIKKSFGVRIERGAGAAAGFPDDAYQAAGAELADAGQALASDVVLKFHKPPSSELLKLKKGALSIASLRPYNSDGTVELAELGVDCIGMELIPRTSRAQSMDALSSQAGIAGYRAVIEACARYGRFFPMMMTSAGSSKACKVAVLGAGVAGLQAIATARRLGAQVEAYDIRAEVKEQIISLGAKNLEVEVGEEGSGAGGYAKELSEEAKKRQQASLTEKLKKFDVIISTANVPGRKSPVLVTEEAVRGMRPGSVIVDMAAANGGNCPLSEPDQIIVKHGVTIVGLTNFAAMVPADSSHFYSQNLVNLLGITHKGNELNLEDDIVAASLVTYKGAPRKR